MHFGAGCPDQGLLFGRGQLTCDLGVVCHSYPTDIVVGCGRNFPRTSGPMAVETNKDKLDTVSKESGGGSLNSIN